MPPAALPLALGELEASEASEDVGVGAVLPVLDASLLAALVAELASLLVAVERALSTVFRTSDAKEVATEAADETALGAFVKAVAMAPGGW